MNVTNLSELTELLRPNKFQIYYIIYYYNTRRKDIIIYSKFFSQKKIIQTQVTYSENNI